MANVYWFGGTGNWSDAAHWSNNSGNSPESLHGSAPGADDDVVFDTLSSSEEAAYTVTVDAAATCKDFTMDGPSATDATKVTWAGTAALAISGNMNLSGGTAGITQTYAGVITFNAASGTITIDTNSVVQSCRFSFTGGCTYSLSNDLTISASSTSNALNLDSGIFDANGKSVIFTGGANIIEGEFTFFNLTKTGTTAKTNYIKFFNSVTITGTFTINGNSSTSRILVQSKTIGSAITIDAAIVTITNADFQDITGAGAGSWDLSAITGLSGDCGGNSGITFTTSDTMYFMKASGDDNWSTAGNWFLATDGGGAGRVPLPQDDVVFDANSFDAAGQVLTQDMPRAGRNITWAGDGEGAVANDPVWTTSTAASIFGSLTLVDSDTMVLTASTQAYTFEGRASYTLTTAGQSFAKALVLSAPDGTLTIQDNLVTTAQVQVLYGTLNANNKNLTMSFFNSSSNTGARTITMGSGTWTLTTCSGTNTWYVASSATVSAGTSTIKITDATSNAITFIGGTKTYNNVWFSRGTSTATITVTGSNTFNQFKDDGSAAHTISLTTGTTQTVQAWSVSGSAGALITVASTTTTNATLAKIGDVVQADYLSVDYITGSPVDTWYMGKNSTDGGHNVAVYFTSFPIDDKKSIQDKLNTIAGTTGLSMQDALNVENGTTGVSLQGAMNTYAETTGLSTQDAANAKAGTTGLSIQDAINSI